LLVNGDALFHPFCRAAGTQLASDPEIDYDVRHNRRKVMRQLGLLAALCTVIVLLMSAIAGADDERAPAVTDQADDVARIQGGNAEFALDLFHELRGEGGNILFSPFSISSALAMTYAGARGSTAAQMADVLHFTLEGEGLHKAFADLTKALNDKGAAGGVDLSIANALWGQAGHEFLDDFVSLNSNAYGAGLRHVDFGGNPEASRKMINGWVSKSTGEKIKELLERGDITPDVLLVLTSAIYFRGGWAIRFDEAKTKPERFYQAPDKGVPIPMMRETGDFGYMETGGLKLLELPYEGQDLSMIILLPRMLGGLEAVERSLTPGHLDSLCASAKKQRVRVNLPKFRITGTYRLNDVLTAMGMTDAFRAGKADFSGIDGTRDLFISLVTHKAYVEVSEQGTEAAAATAVPLKKGLPPRLKEFRADHPFLFVIREGSSGSILFIGRVMDPTS
jgi:serpin B